MFIRSGKPWRQSPTTSAQNTMLKQTKTVYCEKQAKKPTMTTSKLSTLGRLNPRPQVSTSLDV
jgi:hypothetical protein